MPDREKVIERLTGLKELLKLQKDILGYGSFIEDINDALTLLKEQDTVEHALEVLRANGWKQTEPICSECDAVHVVLCKDCKHYMTIHCICDGCCISPDWYCASGVRK